jgi:hypothetical protein
MVEDKTKLAKFVGVLAIVSSAAGASVSSMNAFEGSQAVAARDQGRWRSFSNCIGVLRLMF